MSGDCWRQLLSGHERLNYTSISCNSTSRSLRSSRPAPCTAVRSVQLEPDTRPVVAASRLPITCITDPQQFEDPSTVVGLIADIEPERAGTTPRYILNAITPTRHLSIRVFQNVPCQANINKNLCGRDGRTICGPVCHCNSLGGAT